MGTGDKLANQSPAPIASTTAGFGSTSIERANETSSSAVAAQAQAQIQARYIVAMQRPRSWDDVRAKLLRECHRPGFADVARYSKPQGNTRIEGPSIRFAEAALRCMGNAVVQTMVTWEDETQRIVRVSVTDVENNLPYESDVVVQKTVERSTLKEGQSAVSARTNSSGKMVYLVRATDDDMLTKQNALVSKALRTAALRLLPGDILEDCMTAVVETQSKRDATDPDAERKRMIDAFATINVMPSALAEYVGHDIGHMTPAELLEMRSNYVAIRDGDTTWAVLAEARAGSREKPEPTPTQAASASVKAKIDAKVKP